MHPFILYFYWLLAWSTKLKELEVGKHFGICSRSYTKYLRNRKVVFKEICHQYRKYPTDWQGERVKECERGLGLSSFPALPKKKRTKKQRLVGLFGGVQIWQKQLRDAALSIIQLADRHTRRQKQTDPPRDKSVMFSYTYDLPPPTPNTTLSVSISPLFLTSG